MATESGSDIIFCGDDYIFAHASAALRENKGNARLASFYNSELIGLGENAVASVDINARELGIRACDRLIELITNDKDTED